MGFITDIFGGGGSDYRAKSPTLNTTDYRSSVMNRLKGVESNDARNKQMMLVEALTAAMNGQGPSLAEQQLKDATDKNMQQAAAFGGSMRGISPALMARQILQNQAAMGQGMAGQAAQLRANEVATARGQLGDALSGVRTGDMNELGTIAGAQNQQNATISSNELGAQSINAGIENANTAGKSGIIGGALGGVGAALGLQKGGKVPGKAEVAGDSPKNDKVPAKLSPGEIVIPRSIAKDPEAAKKFVEHVNAQDKKKSKGSKAEGYARVLEAHRKLTKELKKMYDGGMVEEC